MALPTYTGGQAVAGTAVLLGLCLLIAVGLGAAWWRHR